MNKIMSLLADLLMPSFWACIADGVVSAIAVTVYHFTGNGFWIGLGIMMFLIMLGDMCYAWNYKKSKKENNNDK